MNAPNIITWNFANWLTVCLMALLAFVGIRLALEGVGKLRSSSDD